MPFGLSNAPASFQGYINKILAEKLDIFIIVYLDDILIYIEDPGHAHVDAVWSVLDILKKHGLYANLKKCCFHKDEVFFLGYVASAQSIRMEDERIEAFRNWPEPKSVRDIQVFLGFANFYCCFIWGFSKIASPLTSMLRTSNLSENSLNKMVEDDEVVDGSNNSGQNLAESKKSKNYQISAKSRKAILNKIKISVNSTMAATADATGYLTPKARGAFTQLRQAFIEAPILWYFDPECHIRIETDASGYAITRVLSQLNFYWVALDVLKSDGSKSDKSDFGQ